MKHCITLALLVGASTMAAENVAAQNSAPSTAQTGATPQGQDTATTALQDARVTLARLTERSMPQDARESLGRLSTSFRALYKAYTGEDPDAQKTASQAAAATPAPPPSPSAWKSSYDAVQVSLNYLVGPAGGGASGTTAGGSQAAPTGTSGTSSAQGLSSLTQPVRQDLQMLREQLARFNRAAGGTDTAAAQSGGSTQSPAPR